MAKSKRGRKARPTRRAAAKSTPVAPSGNRSAGEGESAEQKAERFSAFMEENATDEDRKTLEDKPPAATGLALDELVAKCEKAYAWFKLARQRVDEEERIAREKQGVLDEKISKLKSDQELAERHLSDASEKKAEAEAARKAVEERERDLQARETDLNSREVDADCGFLERNRQWTEKFYGERQGILEGIESERKIWEKELFDRRSSLEAEAKERAERWKDEVEKREEALKDREEASQRESARLDRKARDLAIKGDLVDEDMKEVEARADRIAAGKLLKKKQKITALKERLDEALRLLGESDGRIRELEEAARRFGDRTPEEMIDELEDGRRERDRLREELRDRPSAEDLLQLRRLKSQSEDWVIERERLLNEVAVLKQDVVHKRIEVTELDGLRRYKDALEACNELLNKALTDGIQKVNDLVKGAGAEVPFPYCSEMDSSDHLNTRHPLAESKPSLKALAEYVRQRMASNPETERARFYSPADVRSFIGGLAMSRLHLLQGISGTGKTSLPVEFARAIDAGSELVAVQAGWRDRQDLIGHYNTFEKRFHESQFLKALYRAGSPRHREMPFILVLDEMNLSHPEQYLADLLSELEQEEHSPRLELMSGGVDDAPERLGNRGEHIPIPDNVWFVGTANHDETTMDFADKTYDRAHVMELPHYPEKFEVEFPAMQTVGFKALESAFAKAREKHAGKAEDAYNFMEEHLRNLLGERFGVGWGNRLRRQMGRYVPVVVDCGGSIGEATDHIVATKLLRKIRDRHDNRPDDVIALRDRIMAEWPWPSRGQASDPPKSIGILDKELQRLKHDEG